jgi:hypothetical protein
MQSDNSLDTGVLESVTPVVRDLDRTITVEFDSEYAVGDFREGKIPPYGEFVLLLGGVKLCIGLTRSV